MCIDIVEICFRIAHWQISSIFHRVICPRHDNGGTLSFNVFIIFLIISITINIAGEITEVAGINISGPRPSNPLQWRIKLLDSFQ